MKKTLKKNWILESEKRRCRRKNCKSFGMVWVEEKEESIILCWKHYESKRPVINKKIKKNDLVLIRYKK